MKNQTEMTPKQKRFCEEYVVDLCGRQAAVRAGYSAKTAAVMATELLKKPAISRLVEELNTEVSHSCFVSAERVVTGLTEIAFNVEGEKTSDRLKALELLGKRFGLFTDRVEVAEEKPQVILYWPHNGKDTSVPRPTETDQARIEQEV